MDREPIRRFDLFRRSDYMTSVDELAILHAPGGLDSARLAFARDRLLILCGDGQIVNPRSVHLHKLGLFSFGLRGSGYYMAACRAGDFRPGAPLDLVREPGNRHDPNAIAILARGARRLSGYVNKQNAKRMAPILDAGVDFVAISTRGGGPGEDLSTPMVLAGDRRLMSRLARGLNLSF